MFSNALKLSVAVVLATAAALSTTGCAAESDTPEEIVGDDNNEIVSERQLYGTELPDKTFVLTFDDGPGPRTGELADFLAEKGLHGTFFMNGHNYPGRQAQTAKVIDHGHLLANHSQNHLQLTKLSSSKLYSEIQQTDKIITQLQPAGPFLLRAPFGAWSSNTARNLNGTDMKKYVGSIFWEVGGQLTATAAADWDCWGKGYSVERCAELYIQEAHTRKRGIILMHDVHNKSVDMAKIVITRLLSEGYKFAKITEVPSVKRALGAVADESPSKCYSSTLGRSVDKGTCVQSARDQKWSVCSADVEWASVTGAQDAKCTSGAFPLQR